MNREIKFRGKALMSIEELNEMGFEHENGWVIGNLIQNGNRPFIVGDVVEATDEYMAHEWWVLVIPETIGQYTGLKDKNGTEIYEGDIVEYKDYSGGAYIFGKQPKRKDIIEWRPSYNGYKLRGWGYGFKGEDVEVMGNIHQNPELLEESK